MYLEAFPISKMELYVKIGTVKYCMNVSNKVELFVRLNFISVFVRQIILSEANLKTCYKEFKTLKCMVRCMFDRCVHYINRL